MAEGGDDVQLKIVYAKATHALAKPPTTTIKDLKAEIETLTGCPASTMKLMYKGLLSAPNKPELDERTLAEATITKKAKILVVGASADDLQSVAAVDGLAKKGIFKAEAAATASATAAKSKWSEETKHKKILDKGVPEDAPFAYRPGSDPLPATALGGMVNHLHQKVRIQFKMGENMVVISTKERTSKVDLAKIHSIKSEKIPHHEEYHILGIQLGPTAASMYFIYWFPAQYVSAAKSAYHKNLELDANDARSLRTTLLQRHLWSRLQSTFFHPAADPDALAKLPLDSDALMRAPQTEGAATTSS